MDVDIEWPTLLPLADHPRRQQLAGHEDFTARDLRVIGQIINLLTLQCRKLHINASVHVHVRDTVYLRGGNRTDRAPAERGHQTDLVGQEAEMEAQADAFHAGNLRALSIWRFSSSKGPQRVFEKNL
jgi:hypothetical protein